MRGVMYLPESGEVKVELAKRVCDLLANRSCESIRDIPMVGEPIRQGFRKRSTRRHRASRSLFRW